MTTPPTDAHGSTSSPTDRQLSLSKLAAALATANPDAAGELGRLLLLAAEERKRPRGFGIEIRVNSVTGLAELRNG